MLATCSGKGVNSNILTLSQPGKPHALRTFVTFYHSHLRRHCTAHPHHHRGVLGSHSALRKLGTMSAPRSLGSLEARGGTGAKLPPTHTDLLAGASVS